MGWLEVIVLGIVQGIAEFLPISSSGHLVIVEALFEHAHGEPLAEVLTLNIVLHVGTLAAVLWFYRQRIARLFHQDRSVISLLIAATLPAVLGGVILKGLFSQALSSALVAGCMLPLTGLLLLFVARRSDGTREYQDLTYAQALTIGAFQALALLPGMSRSGATIAAGLLLGLRRESAATFSFLMAIPAITGACVLSAAELFRTGDVPLPWAMLAGGMAVSFVVGLGALWWLLRWLAQGRLHLFAYWCIPLGLVIIVWQLAAL